MTSNFAGSANPMVNWQEGGYAAYAGWGETMSESSGHWTFPSTGLWEVHLKSSAWNDVGFEESYMPTIFSSVNSGAAYSGVALSHQSVPDSNTSYMETHCWGMVDVGDETTFRIKFRVQNVSDETNTETSGNSTLFLTGAVFKKYRAT
jgi:hypothetical protein